MCWGGNLQPKHGALTGNWTGDLDNAGPAEPHWSGLTQRCCNCGWVLVSISYIRVCTALVFWVSHSFDCVVFIILINPSAPSPVFPQCMCSLVTSCWGFLPAALLPTSEPTLGGHLLLPLPADLITPLSANQKQTQHVAYKFTVIDKN